MCFTLFPRGSHQHSSHVHSSTATLLLLSGTTVTTTSSYIGRGRMPRISTRSSQPSKSAKATSDTPVRTDRLPAAGRASKRRRMDTNKGTGISGARKAGPSVSNGKISGSKPRSASTSCSKRAQKEVHNEDAAADSVVVVQVPGDFSFSQAACSYGYYLVPPNSWQPCKDPGACKDAGTFRRPLRYGPRLQNTAKCTITQVPSSSPGRASTSTSSTSPLSLEHSSERRAEGGGATGRVGAPLRVHVTSAKKLTKSDQEDIRSQVRRMFQTTVDLKPWFSLSPEAEKRGYGRLFRSPTVFEDMVKSITGCNMKFSGTIRMNKLLCEHFGCDQAFPTPEDLKGVQAEDLKEKAKVGYRADRILRLAQSFRDGTVDPGWLEAPERTREEVLKFVKSLHGFGDYAAGNVAMLLGFYEEVPLDSETVRHFKDYHGVTTKNVKEVAPRAKREYQPYAPYQFLQYWYEMIKWHEKSRGQEAHLWDASAFASLQ